MAAHKTATDQWSSGAAMDGRSVSNELNRCTVFLARWAAGRRQRRDQKEDGCGHRTGEEQRDKGKIGRNWEANMQDRRK